MSEKKINKQRSYWLDKSRLQLEEIFFASLERNKTQHKELMDDLATSLIVLWRMDNKLQLERKSNGRKVSNS